MWDLIASLFDGYGVIAMIVFAVGILFCLVEIFLPGFGIFGIVGGIFTVAGIVIRYLLDYDLQHLIFMIIFVISVIIIAALIMIYSAKHGLLGKAPFIENKTSISVNYNSDNKEFIKLLGKITFAESKFTPAGRFVYEGITYDARTYGEYLEKGTKIQVVEVIGDTIYVKKVN